MLDLGNFLWDMVQYFKAAHVLKDRVDIGSMYVPSSPILGRLNCGDYYRVVISEILKKSSKKNFLPCNTTRIARERIEGIFFVDD